MILFLISYIHIRQMNVEVNKILCRPLERYYQIQVKFLLKKLEWEFGVVGGGGDFFPVNQFIHQIALN